MTVADNEKMQELAVAVTLLVKVDLFDGTVAFEHQSVQHCVDCMLHRFPGGS